MSALAGQKPEWFKLASKCKTADKGQFAGGEQEGQSRRHPQEEDVRKQLKQRRKKEAKTVGWRKKVIRRQEVMTGGSHCCSRGYAFNSPFISSSTGILSSQTEAKQTLFCVEVSGVFPECGRLVSHTNRLYDAPQRTEEPQNIRRNVGHILAHPGWVGVKNKGAFYR